MKTPMEIFKKYGAYYYENDEQAIIDAMIEYAEQKVSILDISSVDLSVCEICKETKELHSDNLCKECFEKLPC
ncbi:MAG TPA: hypothetical protein VIK86_06365 [Candidatus Paceibacterota bacterium]